MTSNPSNLTTTPIVETGPENQQREFGGQKTVEFLFGIKRTAYYQGCHEGWWQSVKIRKPGCQHGRRLAYLPSVRKWMMRQMKEQSKGK